MAEWSPKVGLTGPRTGACVLCPAGPCYSCSEIQKDPVVDIAV